MKLTLKEIDILRGINYTKGRTIRFYEDISNLNAPITYLQIQTPKFTFKGLWIIYLLEKTTMIKLQEVKTYFNNDDKLIVYMLMQKGYLEYDYF